MILGFRQTTQDSQDSKTETTNVCLLTTENGEQARPVQIRPVNIRPESGRQLNPGVYRESIEQNETL